MAYLNGKEFARANINGNVTWNSTSPIDHEAVLYTNGIPERFDLSKQDLNKFIVPGENVFCIEVHNVDANSSDMSIIPFLSFALKDGTTFFRDAPKWVNPSSIELHTNFKISKEGETIYLSDQNRILRDSLQLLKMQVDHSYGRIPDGSNALGVFTSSTPGASNNKSTVYKHGYTPTPTFNRLAGFYNSPIDLEITTDNAAATIRYTLDGSEPTASSLRYSAQIHISETKCIRARCFASNQLPGEINTATFFINVKNYSIPVLSVNTNNTNLYGSKGIFSNWSQTFNIPAHAEYFEKDKTLAFCTNAGMQIDGGAGGSRSYDQHSFRIEPGNGTFGDGDVRYPMIDRRPNRTNYPSFYVRNGSNQYLRLPYKDALQVMALGQNTYTYYSAYRPIVVYINGGYFGVYELREKMNEDYIQDNYHLDIADLDLIGVSYYKGQTLAALVGSINPFLADRTSFLKMNIQSPDYLDQVGKFLDIKNYTDYMIAQIWVGNIDWPQNNIKAFRCKGTDYKWRWMIIDLELSLQPNGWTSNNYNSFQYLNGLGTNNYYSAFWYNLIQNETYKSYFINRFCDLMNTNYDFKVIGALEQEMYDELYPEMNGEFERWGSTNITTQMNGFKADHNTFRGQLSGRTNYIQSQMLSQYKLVRKVTTVLEVEPKGAGNIQISTIVPETYPWRGAYFSTTPIEIKAIPHLGYTFSHWENDAFIKDVNNALIKGEFTQSVVTLHANFEKEEIASGGMVISEINYKPGKESNIDFDWIEFCNLSNETMNLKGWYFITSNPKNVHVFHNDFIFQPNERKVISNNFSGFQNTYPGVKHYSTQFNFQLGNTADILSLYNPAQEIIFQVNYSDFLPWPLADNYTGRTLELASVESDYSNPLVWFKGCIGGSPGSEYKTCSSFNASSPKQLSIENLDVKVYPIPAIDYIYVDLSLHANVTFCTLKLYNFMGQQIKSITLDKLQMGDQTIRINLEGLEDNLYLLQTSTSLGDKTVKITKHR